jgi:hypothetical protein
MPRPECAREPTFAPEQRQCGGSLTFTSRPANFSNVPASDTQFLTEINARLHQMSSYIEFTAHLARRFPQSVRQNHGVITMRVLIATLIVFFFASAASGQVRIGDAATEHISVKFPRGMIPVSVRQENTLTTRASKMLPDGVKTIIVSESTKPAALRDKSLSLEEALNLILADDKRRAEASEGSQFHGYTVGIGRVTPKIKISKSKVACKDVQYYSQTAGNVVVQSLSIHCVAQFEKRIYLWATHFIVDISGLSDQQRRAHIDEAIKVLSTVALH